MPITEYRFAEKPRTSGFTAFENAVLWDASLSADSRLLYAMIYDITTFSHEQPSQKQIAEKLGCTDKTLRARIAELVGAGLVEVTKRGNSQVSVFTVYSSDNRSAQEVNGKNYRSDPDPERSELPFMDGKNYRSPRACDSLSEPKTGTKTEIPSESPVVQGEIEGVEIASGSAVAKPLKAPKLVKVAGQNLAFNALKTATNAGHGEDTRIAAALNGKGPRRPGIRAFYAAEHLPPAVDDFASDADWRSEAECWERDLATEVERRAELYIELMPPGALLTPTALCAWWGRVATTPRQRGRGITSSDWDVMPEAIERAKELFGIPTGPEAER